jgi:hypothetical protein
MNKTERNFELINVFISVGAATNYESDFGKHILCCCGKSGSSLEMGGKAVPSSRLKHLICCPKAVERLYQGDKKGFQAVVNFALNSGIAFPTKSISRLNSIGKEQSSPSALTEKPYMNSFLQDCQIIPLISEADRSLLPKARGLYAVFSEVNGLKSSVYVGKSFVGIRSRWVNHHRLPEIKLLLSIGVKVFIYCVTYPSTPFCSITDAELSEMEARLISEFQPVLNRRDKTLKGLQGVSSTHL